MSHLGASILRSMCICRVDFTYPFEFFGFGVARLSSSVVVAHLLESMKFVVLN